ncbi:MAG: peptidylprolyl isomerase [Duncaniella sp.]|nr:peptidylprolyl isomerase [Duncaniella sp.]
MEKIQPGKYVEIAYELSASIDGQDETPVHTVEATDPERFIYGVTPGMIQPLTDALEGLEQGATFDIHVPADKAIPFNPDDVVTLEADIFRGEDGKIDSRVKPGAKLPMQTAEGYMITGVVLEVTDQHVKMDFNHPLAGYALHFANGKVVTVRDASPEELHPAQGCGGGCGGCGGGCGDKADTEGCGGGCCGGCN